MSNRCILLLGALLYSGAAAAHEETLPEIIVPGHVQEALTHTVKVTPDMQGLTAPDAAALIRSLPGADYNDNGPLSGQTQYRGMYGPRMNVRLDGMHINSGGPNWMDPPLHYIPMVLLDSLEMTRGIAPVSQGPGIGGDIEATYLSSHYTDSDDYSSSGRITLGGHSVDGGYDVGGILAIANDRRRLHLLGSRERGHNRDAGGGDIADTGYRRSFIGAGLGLRLARQDLALDYRRSMTGASGNPVLPLDIEFLNTDLLQLRQSGDIGGFDLQTRLGYTHVAHRMTNYRLRPAPDFSSLPLPPFIGSDRRYVNAGSSGLGYSLQAGHDLAGGRLTLGVDGHLDKNSASVHDPDVAPFFITNYNAARSNTYGVFAQWQAAVAARIKLELGLRYDRVEMNSGVVDAQPANLPMAAMPGTPPYAVRMLRDRFNAADRSRSDNNLDWVARINIVAGPATVIELGLARKTRSPSYIERYSWIPLEVNAGLGDGNNYVGAINLRPEVSHQAELGVEWQGDSASFTPRLFYRRVHDYIQGVPVTDMLVRAVSANAGSDPAPLQFANVDAELYGADALFGLRLGRDWRLNGSVSYTRGRRTDVHDDLYRISPLHGRLALQYRSGNWSATVEGVAYAGQHHVSRVITGNSAVGDSHAIPGYAVVNLHGDYAVIGGRLLLRAGVENLFDRDYTDPLSGFNRVPGGAVPVGERLHGAGRNVYAGLTWKW